MSDDRPTSDELVELAIRAATAYGRADLAERLGRLRAAGGPTEPSTVVVVGEFKSGKSALVNALAGFEVCPVEDDVSTTTLTVIGHAEMLTARAVWRTGDTLDEQLIAPDDIAQLVTEEHVGDRQLGRVHVDVPSPLTAAGVVIIDTPGVAGLGGASGPLALAAASIADAVIVVTSSAQELTAPEVRLVARCRELCDVVAVLETKTDMRTGWQRIVELDRQHLEDAGVGVAGVLGISANLHRIGMDRGDRELTTESNIPQVTAWLTKVADDRLHRLRRRTLAAATEIVGVLTDQFTTERTVLTSDREDDRLRELTRANAEVERARLAGNRWVQSLNDTFGDVSSALDRDLRERSRSLMADIDELIERSDPSHDSEQFEHWLHDRTTTVVTEHLDARHRGLLTALDAVATAVDDGTAAPTIEVVESAAVEHAAAPVRINARRASVVGQGLTLLRTSYGGLAMLGFFGGFAGVAVAAPVMLGAGLILGGKGVRDERTRQVTARRAQVRAAAQKYVDDVWYRVSSETRETVRATQRQARDHFGARVRERQSGAAEAAARAKAAYELDRRDRPTRLTDIDAELRRLEGLANRLQLFQEESS